MCSVPWMKHRRKQRSLPIAFTFYSGERGGTGVYGLSDGGVGLSFKNGPGGRASWEGELS